MFRPTLAIEMAMVGRRRTHFVIGAAVAVKTLVMNVLCGNPRIKH